MQQDPTKALQAVMILSKHLTDLLPFLMALQRVPSDQVGRVGLVQTTARTIANTHELAKDWYTALELITGEDLSGRSVADLLILSKTALNSAALGDVWRACYHTGLFDKEMMGQWAIFESLA